MIRPRCRTAGRIETAIPARTAALTVSALTYRGRRAQGAPAARAPARAEARPRVARTQPRAPVRVARTWARAVQRGAVAWARRTQASPAEPRGKPEDHVQARAAVLPTQVQVPEVQIPEAALGERPEAVLRARATPTAAQVSAVSPDIARSARRRPRSANSIASAESAPAAKTGRANALVRRTPTAARATSAWRGIVKPIQCPRANVFSIVTVRPPERFV